VEGKYFSDVIDYDKHIKGKQLIEIVSGIGSGKTSWVRKLADMEIDGHKPSILFITSRKAVANAEVLKYNKSKAVRWINLETECERVGFGVKKQKLVYCTNGGIETFFKDRYNPNDESTFLWKLFDFIILDEAHSLATDAVFTRASFVVERFIKYAVHENPNCHVILMTGTHKPIDWIFGEKTLSDDRYAKWDFFSECRHVEPQEVWIDTKANATKEMLRYLKSGSRIVYFASSVSRIKELRSELQKNGIKASAIGIGFAKSDKHNEMFSPDDIQAKKQLADYIAAHECLPDDIRVFLSTSQNKEGITISNEDIYYIFAESTSMCELRQMAGRVRNDKVSDQIKVFHVVYDNPYRFKPADVQYEFERDSHYLKHLYEGLLDLKDHNQGYAEQSIKDIEKAFENVKFDFLYKKKFVLYWGRINGLFEQLEDDTNLKYYVSMWNKPIDVGDEYNENIQMDVPQYKTGKALFQEWFPYSTVKLNSVKATKEQLHEQLRTDVSNYLTEHDMLDKPISSDIKDAFTDWLIDYLQKFDCKTADIAVPSGKVLGKKLKQAMGITIKQHGGHKKSLHIMTLVEENLVVY